MLEVFVGDLRLDVVGGCSDGCIDCDGFVDFVVVGVVDFLYGLWCGDGYVCVGCYCF